MLASAFQEYGFQVVPLGETPSMSIWQGPAAAAHYMANGRKHEIY